MAETRAQIPPETKAANKSKSTASPCCNRGVKPTTPHDKAAVLRLIDQGRKPLAVVRLLAGVGAEGPAGWG
jgi:hypothetical protein